MTDTPSPEPAVPALAKPEKYPDWYGRGTCFACAGHIPCGGIGVIWQGRPYHRDCYPHASAQPVRVNPPRGTR